MFGVCRPACHNSCIENLSINVWTCSHQALSNVTIWLIDKYVLGLLSCGFLRGMGGVLKGHFCLTYED